jgi:hypothetical protein
MTSLFVKLNLKDHSEIVVLDASPSFDKAPEYLQDVRVARSLDTIKEVTFPWRSSLGGRNWIECPNPLQRRRCATPRELPRHHVRPH